MPSRPSSRQQQVLLDAAVAAYRSFTALQEANRTAERAALDDVREALWDAWQAGTSVSDLAAGMGVHRQRVYQLLDEAEARQIVDAADRDGRDPYRLAAERDATRRTVDEIDRLLTAS